MWPKSRPGLRMSAPKNFTNITQVQNNMFCQVIKQPFIYFRNFVVVQDMWKYSRNCGIPAHSHCNTFWLRQLNIRKTRAKTKAQDKAKRDQNSWPRHSKLSKNTLRRHSKFRGSWGKLMACKEILKTYEHMSTKNKWKRQIWDYSIE